MDTYKMKDAVKKDKNAVVDDCPNAQSLASNRFLLASALLIFGFLCSLCVPLIVQPQLPDLWRLLIVGVLVFGILVVFSVLSVRMMDSTGIEIDDNNCNISIFPSNEIDL